MAFKRLKGGSATGGTGDLKPQILTISVVENAVDDYTVVQAALPTVRFGPSQNKSTITEFLKVWFYVNVEDFGDTQAVHGAHIATTALGRITAEASTLATLAVDWTNPRIIASVADSSAITTSGCRTNIFPQVVDLTDNNGNGVLVATDSIFLIALGIGNAAAGTVTAKILYRTVNVGIQEYVGIVQSQQ